MENVLNQYTEKEQLNPYVEALKITILFALFGLVWIGLPIEMVQHILGDAFKDVQFLWSIRSTSFVMVSSIIIYYLVFKRMKLFNLALTEAKNNYIMQKGIEKDLNHMAFYDKLTGLPNRAYFEKKINQLTLNDDKKFALLYMDVDNFKNINDTLGHIAGDKFLKYISKLLKQNTPDTFFVSRLGGDEFAIIIEDISDQNEILHKIEHLQKRFQRAWKYNNMEFFVSASIGIVFYPEHGEASDILLRNSDVAMYNVKKNNKNNYCIYSDELQKNTFEKITLANELHRAVENNEFCLLYQPIMDLSSGNINGVEALIRWNHPEKGIISPLDFIPVAEETGIIHDIGYFVLKTAFYQKMSWEQSGFPNLKMSINVSGKSLLQNDFLDQVQGLLDQTKINAADIQLEITETVLIEELHSSSKVLDKLSQMGIKIALDDFGTGYSSLTYLRNLPIDVIKLDGSFVKGIMENGEDIVIVESVINLTHDLSLQMVAEGIEDLEQLSVLKLNRCDFGQGYLFSRPVAPEKIEEFLFCNQQRAY